MALMGEPALVVAGAVAAAAMLPTHPAPPNHRKLQPLVVGESPGPPRRVAKAGFLLNLMRPWNPLLLHLPDAHSMKHRLWFLEQSCYLFLLCLILM